MDFAPDEPPPAAPKAPSLVVVGSRPCLSCGYDLQGLSTEGLCPECGAPVARSLKGNLLEFAAPEYLRTLNLGAVLIIWGAFAPLLAGGILVAVKAAIESDIMPGAVSGNGSEILAALLSAAGASFSFVGWFLFSRPDPGQIGADGGEKARRWVRIMLVAEVVMTLAGVVASLVPGMPRTVLNSSGATATGANVPLVIIILGVAIVLLSAGISAARASLGAWYIYTLASRVPDSPLRAFAKTMIWLFPVLMTVGYAVCGLGPLAAWIISIVIAVKCRRAVRDIRARIAPRPAHSDPITTHQSGS